MVVANSSEKSVIIYRLTRHDIWDEFNFYFWNISLSIVGFLFTLHKRTKFINNIQYMDKLFCDSHLRNHKLT